MRTMAPGKMMKANVTSKGMKVAKVATKSRYTTEVGEYNGRPTLKITDSQAANPKWADFTFGIGKAKMILGSLEAIKAFVAENDKSEGK